MGEMCVYVCILMCVSAGISSGCLMSLQEHVCLFLTAVHLKKPLEKHNKPTDHHRPVLQTQHNTDHESDILYICWPTHTIMNHGFIIEEAKARFMCRKLVIFMTQWQCLKHNSAYCCFSLNWQRSSSRTSWSSHICWRVWSRTHTTLTNSTHNIWPETTEISLISPLFLIDVSQTKWRVLNTSQMFHMWDFEKRRQQCVQQWVIISEDLNINRTFLLTFTQIQMNWSLHSFTAHKHFGEKHLSWN